MRRLETFDEIECTVLAASIARAAEALPLVPELELDDFGDPFRRAAFEAVRNLEAAGARVDVLAVADAMFASWQRANDGKCTVHDDVRITAHLGLTLLHAESYGDDLARLLPRHARALRTIRYARQERMAG